MQFFNIPALLPGFFPSPLYWFSSAIVWDLLYGSAYLLLFKRLSHLHIRWWYYPIAGLLYSFAISLVGNILAIIIMLVIIHLTIVHRRISLNITGAQFIYANFILLITFGCCGSIITHLYNLAVKVPNYNFVYYVLGIPKIIVSFFVAYGLLVLTSKLFTKYTNNVVIPYPILSWLISILMLTFLGYQFRVNGGGAPAKLPVTIAVTVGYGIVFLFLIAATSKYYYYKSMTASLQFEVTNLQNYTSRIEEMYDEMRHFRHDYKNVLYSLTGALQDQDLQEANQIVHQVLEPSATTITQKSSTLAQLENVQNVDIKSLLYNKVVGILDAGMAVTIEVAQPIKFGSAVAPLDLLRIISNLLDNAIHAAQESADHKLTIALFAKDQQQWIVIGNSTKEETVNLHQRASQHSDLTASHGLGLRNLRMILARYPEVQHNVQSSHHWLEQQIILPE